MCAVSPTCASLSLAALTLRALACNSRQVIRKMLLAYSETPRVRLSPEFVQLLGTFRAVGFLKGPALKNQAIPYETFRFLAE